MRASIGKLVACSAILAGLSGMGMPTAKAGITLVISVSDANGSATETVSSTDNQITFNNTTGNIMVNVVTSMTGNAAVFNDFGISVTGVTNAPGTSAARTTDSTTTIDYNNHSTTGGSSGAISIGVYPTDYSSPGTTGTPEYVSSTFSVLSGRFKGDTFVTSLAQSSGTFTPGYQSVSPNSPGVSTIYSPFTLSGSTYRLYNVASFSLPVDTTTDRFNAVSFQGTSTVTLQSDGPPSGTQTTPIPTPEPATLAMVFAGMPVVGLLAWRRKRAAGLVRD